MSALHPLSFVHQHEPEHEHEHERTTKHISHISRMELLHAMQVWRKNMGLARLNVIAS